MPTATEWASASEPILVERERIDQIRLDAVCAAVTALGLREKMVEREKEAIKSDWKKTREFCPHPKTTYIPDASGNSDWDESCDLCGADMRQVAMEENRKRWKEQRK